LSLARIFKALSEEPRLQILALLREQELSGAEIVAILRMHQSRVSRHLGVLREAGLVESRRDGSWVYFKLASEPDEAVAEALPALAALLDSVLDEAVRARLQAAVLRRRDPVSRFFDEKAGEWDSLRGEVSDELGALKMLAPLLPRGLRLADLGCGTGALLPHLARSAELVLGIDSSAAMLAGARARLLEGPGCRGVRLLRAQLEALPLAAGRLDGVLCHMVLHYTSQPETVVAEMARVVRRGGLVAVADLAPHDHEELRESLAHQWLGFEREEVADWFEKAGIELARYEPGALRLGERGLPMFYACGIKKA
jgi:ubiquinone/menaquinone biosynthesis C-methylase UbiE/DNA-binding transcriptional ArsR family regulator